MKQLEMTPELKKLNSQLEYLEMRLRTAVLGVEARFYRALIKKTQLEIEDLVIKQIDAQDNCES